MIKRAAYTTSQWLSLDPIYRWVALARGVRPVSTKRRKKRELQ